jgi:hypothetical protein
MVWELIVKNYFYFFTAPSVKPVANHDAGGPDECWDFLSDYDKIMRECGI